MNTSVQNGKQAENFFGKDEMAPEEDRFDSYNTRKCIFFGKTKRTNKKATRVCLKVYRKIHDTKIPQPATKEDKYCFFMIAKPLADR